MLKLIKQFYMYRPNGQIFLVIYVICITNILTNYYFVFRMYDNEEIVQKIVSTGKFLKKFLSQMKGTNEVNALD